MFKRFAASIAAGVLVVTGLAAGTAHAADPFTDTVRITGDFDNGNHGYWARLAYGRTVTIRPTAETNVWSVTLQDRGSFGTLRAKSPGAGVDLGAPVIGSFTGRYDFTVTSEGQPSTAGVGRFHDFKCNPAVPARGDCPGMPEPTSNWPALYFPQGAKVKPGAWRWEYRTECERWVNSSAGDRGDITGKRCVRPGTPTAADPACDTQHGTLTIPAQRGVRYEMRRGSNPYRAVRAGEHQVRPGVYWVRAVARDGYRLVGRDGWRLVVKRAEACPTPTPTPTDDATDEPTVSPSPTVEPSQPSTPPAEEPTPTETSVPVPTVTETVTQRTVVERYLPTRVDTGLGGTAK